MVKITPGVAGLGCVISDAIGGRLDPFEDVTGEEDRRAAFVHRTSSVACMGNFVD